MSAAHVDIALIGAGFSGLGMAIRLRRAGYEDFTLLERHADVGGTWWANTYPGCTCDVPSHLYSFSFAPNPDWSHTYSPQPEIRAYLERCARDFDLYRSIRPTAASVRPSGASIAPCRRSSRRSGPASTWAGRRSSPGSRRTRG